MNSRIWLFLISTVVAACSITSHSTTPTERGRHISGDALLARAVEAGPVTLTQVVAADWKVDRSGLINLDHPKAEAAGLEDGGEPIHIYFYVIEHPTEGTFLIDTGVADGFRNPDEAPVSWLVASAMDFESLKIHVDTDAWLAANGPIEGVFLTHLHLDHIMGLPDIPRDVPIYTGPGEAASSSFKNMFMRGTSDGLLDGFGPLNEWRFAPTEREETLASLDIFGDGSVFAIHVPGHTPGNTAFLVRTSEGPQLIVGDACHTDWGWRNQVEPGSFNDDGEQAARSLARLKELERALPGVTVHLGHQHHERDEALSRAQPGADAHGRE